MIYRDKIALRIGLPSLNILLHCTCSLMLFHVYGRQSGPKTQQLFLLNLSVIELIKNFYLLATNTVVIIAPGHIENGWVMIWIVTLYVESLSILAMFLITGDRLAAGVLTIRYKSICTVFRGKMIILCVWCVPLFVISAFLALLYIAYGFTMMKEAVYSSGYTVMPVLYVLFLLFATASYIVIFAIFSKSRRRSSTPESSTFHMFIRSKFYVALLLILSF